jgi:ElaB/YqjD/DUF883 family membrane-anchored ribosome-binding protein
LLLLGVCSGLKEEGEQEMLKQREQARLAEQQERLAKMAAHEASAQARHAVANAEVFAGMRCDAECCAKDKAS